MMPVAWALYILLRIYSGIILLRILMSWVRPDPDHPFVRVIDIITEPVLAPARKLIPTMGPGIDFSPIIVIFLIDFLTRAVQLIPY